MALAIGQKKYSNLNPNGSTQTLSHLHTSGADGFLMVSISMANTVSFASCKFNGVAMTLLSNNNYGTLSQRNAIYGLAVDGDGSYHNIVVTFTGSQWNPTSFTVVSFTGCGGFGNYASTGLVSTTTPPYPSYNSQSLTVSQNSVIYATGGSVNAQQYAYQIDGVSKAVLFSHNTNKIWGGALSSTGLTAGSKIVKTATNYGSITNKRVEILEASAPPQTRKKVMVI